MNNKLIWSLIFALIVVSMPSTTVIKGAEEQQVLGAPVIEKNIVLYGKEKGQVNSVEKKAEAKARLEAEKKINEVKAKALAEKKAAEAAEKAAAEAPAEEATEAPAEEAPATEAAAE